MLIAYAPLLVAIVGALVYGLAGNSKAQEMVRLAFAAGLLVTLLSVASKTVRVW